MRLFLEILVLIVAIALVIIVVIQPSKGEGLGAIGSGGQVFFSKNKELGKLLDKTTTGLAIALFVLLALVELYGKLF